MTRETFRINQYSRRKATTHTDLLHAASRNVADQFSSFWSIEETLCNIQYIHTNFIRIESFFRTSFEMIIDSEGERSRNERGYIQCSTRLAVN